MSVGADLRSAREARGLSVANVSEATRIRATVISAMEADEFGPCGGSFYARGHIRSIARVIGADPELMVAQYDREQGAPPVATLTTPVVERQATPLAERRQPNWLLAAVAAAAVLVVVLAVALLRGGSSPSGTVAVRTPSPSATHAPSPSPSPSPPPTQIAEIPPNQVTVQVRVTGDRCWVHAVGSTGQVLHNGVLTRGATVTWTDPSKISLVFGAPASVDLVVNGKDLGPAGNASSVARLTFGPGDPAVANG